MVLVVALVVGRLIIRCEIVLSLRLEKERVSKLLGMFQRRMFQRHRLVSMHSGQEDQIRMRMRVMIILLNSLSLVLI